MLKRPLMGLGIALTAGVAVGWSDISLIIVILIIAISAIILKRWTDSSYRYIVGLSVFFVVGFCRTTLNVIPEVHLANDIYGTIYKIEEKEKVNYLYMKNQSNQKILVIADKTKFEELQYYKGQIYRIFGVAEAFEHSGNPGQFNEASYYRSQGVLYRLWADKITLLSEGDWMHGKFRWLEYLKSDMCCFYEIWMDNDGSGILKAAVLGERSGLTSDLKRYYQKNGWMHLITTSGLHLSFVAMSVYKRMRKMTIPLKVTTIVAFILMFMYGYMTDFGDSMIRAMGLMMLELIAKVLGRRTDGWTSLFMLASGMLFLYPERIESVGFILTYTAMGGVEYGKWLTKQWRSEKKNLWIDNLCIQIGIYVATLPVLLCTMYEIPIFGFLYNFFMIPLISYMVPIGFAAGIIGVYEIPVLNHLAIAVLKGINSIFNGIHLLPSKVFVCGRPDDWQLVLFAVSMGISIGCIGHRMFKRGHFILIISCVLLMSIRFRVNQIIFMDVGQGDGICILTENGQAVFIDGGSSDVKQLFTYRIEPLLKYYGIDEISAWFLSHGDLDHVSGIQEALENDFCINNVFFPDINEDETLNEIWNNAKEKQIAVQIIKAGDSVIVDDFKIHCIYPCKEWCVDDKNNDSLVLSVQYDLKHRQTETADVTVLLTGDIEKEGEKILMEKGNLICADVLKVAHHGSSGATSLDFLKIVQPNWAIISCGKENRYGHPHSETLNRLEAVNCSWVSTSVQGAVYIQMNREGYTVYGHQKQD